MHQNRRAHHQAYQRKNVCGSIGGDRFISIGGIVFAGRSRRQNGRQKRESLSGEENEKNRHHLLIVLSIGTSLWKNNQQKKSLKTSSETLVDVTEKVGLRKTCGIVFLYSVLCLFSHHLDSSGVAASIAAVVKNRHVCNNGFMLRGHQRRSRGSVLVHLPWFHKTAVGAARLRYLSLRACCSRVYICARHNTAASCGSRFCARLPLFKPPSHRASARHRA